MSDCPDCGRERVETMKEFWKNPSYSCPVDVPRTECNDDSWVELYCTQGKASRLEAALAEQTQRAEEWASIARERIPWRERDEKRIAELEDELAVWRGIGGEDRANTVAVVARENRLKRSMGLPQRPQDGDGGEK